MMGSHATTQRSSHGAYSGTPQHVRFGPGAVAELPDVLALLGAQRPLVVTGPTVAGSPVLAAVQESLAGIDVHVFAGSRPHGPRECSRRGLTQARAHNADVLVSVGGSSPVEVARGIALLLGTGKDFDDLADHPRPGRTQTIPVIAVTTTLSQAEFSNVVGVTNEASGEKQLFFDDGIMPACVVLDAQLTLHTPARLWLSTGVKALDTAIDIFLHFRGVQPFWDSLLLDAVAGLGRLLPACERDADDLGVRQQLQVAAWQGIFPRFHLPVDEAVPRGTPWFGAVARHQLGGVVGAPHGELGGVILPWALRFHAEESQGRQERLAGAFGSTSVQALADDIAALVASLGLPTRLRELGVERRHLDVVAANMAREQPAYAQRHAEMLVALQAML
jgi:alcohol dehydrogenase class IV